MISQLNSPGFLSSRSNLGADISLLFAVTFILMFIFAGIQARRKKGLTHHRMILVSMGLMIAYLFYYFKIRQLGLASAADQLGFSGPGWIYAKILRPLLIAHISIVCVTLYMSIYMTINGFMVRFPLAGGGITLRTGPMRPSKTLWAIALGWLCVLVWQMAAHSHLNMIHQVLFITLGFILPAGAAILIHKTIPNADRRHRIVGRITLFLFSLMLVTTTTTYFLIYIANY